MEGLVIQGLTVSVVIAAILQAMKSAGYPSKYAPITSLFIGVMIALVYAALGSASGESWLYFALQGVLSGAAASGLYEWSRMTVDR